MAASGLKLVLFDWGEIERAMRRRDTQSAALPAGCSFSKVASFANVGGGFCKEGDKQSQQYVEVAWRETIVLSI